MNVVFRFEQGDYVFLVSLLPRGSLDSGRQRINYPGLIYTARKRRCSVRPGRINAEANGTERNVIQPKKVAIKIAKKSWPASGNLRNWGSLILVATTNCHFTRKARKWPF